jgi:hypothetical protein
MNFFGLCCVYILFGSAAWHNLGQLNGTIFGSAEWHNFCVSWMAQFLGQLNDTIFVSAEWHNFWVSWMTQFLGQLNGTIFGSAEWHNLIDYPRRWTIFGFWLERLRQLYDTRLDFLRVREIVVVTDLICLIIHSILSNVYRSWRKTEALLWWNILNVTYKCCPNVQHYSCAWVWEGRSNRTMDSIA